MRVRFRYSNPYIKTARLRASVWKIEEVSLGMKIHGIENMTECKVIRAYANKLYIVQHNEHDYGVYMSDIVQ